MASSRLFVAIILMCVAACMATTPVIQSVSPTTLSTTATTAITIMGTDLPTPTSVTISGIACTGAARVDATKITCTAKPGLGSANLLTITYDTPAKTVSANVVNFAAVGSVTFCSGEAERYIDETSVSTITICGANFGDDVDTTTATGYNGHFIVSVQGQATATVLHHGDSYIIARLPTNIVGLGLRVFVEFGREKVEVPNLRINTAVPAVTGVEQIEGTKRAATIRLAVYGKGFGTPSPSVVITAVIGGYPCTNVKHVSSTEFHCSVTGSGKGANLPVIVTINGAPSVSGSTLGNSPVRFDFPDTNNADSSMLCTPPFGSADVYNSELCNCWSGSAPSDNLISKDCMVHAVCPGRLTTATVVAQSAPSRPTTEFKDDKLYIKQTSPIVRNRRDTVIQFVVPSITGTHVPNTASGTVGSSTCFYPGSIWAKKVNNLDCVDEYYAVLPWSQNQLCGFVEDTTVTTSPTRIFKANLVTSYIETFKKTDGKIHFRKISNSFLLTVTFAKQVIAIQKVVTATIADENAATSMSVTVNGDALYDVASKKTIIEFTTSLAWPYKINVTDTVTGSWYKSADNGATGTVSALANINPTQPGELECDATQDTECEQSWILTIDTMPTGSPPQVCNLKGRIEFNTAHLLCRDYANTGACTGNPNTNFTIQIGKTDLCDSNGGNVDASKGLSATLESFYDKDLSLSQSVFQTGDMVYFKVKVVDPTSSIDRITFADVHVSSSSNSAINDPLFTQNTPGAALTTATMLSTAKFNVTQEFRDSLLMAGSEAELRFEFRLSRLVLNVVNDLSTLTQNDMTKQLTVEATIDIAYHGNSKKRTVIASTLPAVAHHQLTFYDMGDAAEELAPHANDAVPEDDNNGFAFDLFGSSATTVVASVAAVAVAGVAALL